MIRAILHRILNIILGILTGFLVVWLTYIIWLTNFSDWAVEQRVREIYSQIIVASGQSNKWLPLIIDESNVDNAYATQDRIVIYKGLINKSSWDGIAFVLGHEYAHNLLWHTRIEDKYYRGEFAQTAESMADQVGAFLMMKAGYDICKARDEWRELQENQGDYIGGTHMTYGYRKDLLNINCE